MCFFRGAEHSAIQPNELFASRASAVGSRRRVKAREQLYAETREYSSLALFIALPRVN